eukprot:Nitzschia sp. Nitz4//scaffold49_size126201//29214//30128//NITZ4_003633-RA/size126201-processed-gene-0.63-mRNA-1//1//CDS//3329553122//4755//frame0
MTNEIVVTQSGPEVCFSNRNHKFLVSPPERRSCRKPKRIIMLFDNQRNLDSMPYAIDSEMCNKGRRFAATKRRIKFRFGFGNADAMRAGCSASECRGQEHEVVLVWSLTSGKQRVLADGIEVHFSRPSRTEKFECTWTMKSGHRLRVESPWAPLTKDVRQFDLQIDGISFWDMPQIFQLGSSRTRATTRSTPAPLLDLSMDSCSSSEFDVPEATKSPCYTPSTRASTPSAWSSGSNHSRLDATWHAPAPVDASFYAALNSLVDMPPARRLSVSDMSVQSAQSMRGSRWNAHAFDSSLTGFVYAR